MDRRDLLKYTAGAACVAAVPELLRFPLLSQNTELPRIAWPETAVSLAHKNAMIPLLKKFDADRKVTALTANEWDTLATHHQYYHGMHGEAGHLKVVDTIFRNNEVYLKTKYNPEGIDHVIKYGGYVLTMRNAAMFHQVAEKLRVKRYGELDQGHLQNVQYYMNCGDFSTSMGIFYAVLAIVLGPEVGLPFVILGIISDAFGLFGCNSGWI